MSEKVLAPWLGFSTSPVPSDFAGKFPRHVCGTTFTGSLNEVGWSSGLPRPHEPRSSKQRPSLGGGFLESACQDPAGFPSPAHLQLAVPDGPGLANTESLMFVWTAQSNLPGAPTIGRIGDETEGQGIGPLPAAIGHPLQICRVLCP